MNSLQTEALVLLSDQTDPQHPSLPLCLSPIAGQPFLSYVIDAFRRQGIERLTFVTLTHSAAVSDFLTGSYPTLSYTLFTTSGAPTTIDSLRQAVAAADAQQLLITPGEALVPFSFQDLQRVTETGKAICGLVLAPSADEINQQWLTFDADGQVGLANLSLTSPTAPFPTGIYLLNKALFLEQTAAHSFQGFPDYLRWLISAGLCAGIRAQAGIIDLTHPDGYAKATATLTRPLLDLSTVDDSWTLFLDRDGVINVERVGNYVLNWAGFVFSPGVLKALPLLAQKFGRIVIVSNQRGITKGLMTEADLTDIHQRLLLEVTEAGGRIDAILYCKEKEATCFNRKPNPGMALEAVRRFPEIDLSRTIMVGNKPSDMRFGRAAGTYTVFVTTTNPDEPFPHPDTDLRFDSLLQFAEALKP